MYEIGADISAQESKKLQHYLGESFEYVLVVCDEANEACPAFPGATKRLRWSFEGSSPGTGSGEERLEVFWKVRDQVRERIEKELVPTKPEPSHLLTEAVSFSFSVAVKAFGSRRSNSSTISAGTALRKRA